MANVTTWAGLSAFIGDLCGCEVIPGCRAGVIEEVVGWSGSEHKTDTNHAADCDCRDNQQTADAAAGEGSGETNRSLIRRSDHAQPEEPVARRAAVAPFEDGPDQPADSQRHDEK